jgi:hypothetical protein
VQCFAQKVEQSAKGAEYEAGGKCRAKRGYVAPGCDMHDQIRSERPKYRGYYALSALDQIVFSHQGRRAALRFALAPGFDISRLWRFPIRAFGALFRLFVQSQSAVLASANDPVLPEI